MKSSYFCKIGICKGGNIYLLRQTMSQGHIRIRPSRPSVGRSRDIFMKLSSPVLLHSSRPKAVCVQNAICLLRNLCSTFTNILCYIDKTAGYGHRRISRYQNLRPLLSDMNQQSKLHGQRFCRFESGIFVIIDGPQSKTATICCFARVARILCKSLCT